MKLSKNLVEKSIMFTVIVFTSFFLLSLVEAPAEHPVLAEEINDSNNNQLEWDLNIKVKKLNNHIENVIAAVQEEKENRDAHQATLAIQQQVLASQVAQVNEQVNLGNASTPTNEQWAALRKCESAGNYKNVSANGLYFGAYQFAISTWNNLASRFSPSLVGVNPAAAAPADQDFLALKLYELSHGSAWPHCGQYLH